MRCSVDSCDGKAHARGLCRDHYDQLRYLGTLPPPRERHPKPNCSMDGCKREATGRELICNPHTQQRNRRLQQQLAARSCEVDGCGGVAVTRGWCNKHYGRWKRTRDPLGLLLPQYGPECALDSCDNPYDGHRGYCSGHYERLRRGASLAAPLHVYGSYDGCSVDGCEGKHVSSGFCRKHYDAQRSWKKAKALTA